MKSSPSIWHLLKLSRNKKDLKDVTVALFLLCFFAAGSWEKDTKKGAAVTSLRSILFRDDFSQMKSLAFEQVFRYGTLDPNINSSLLFSTY